MDSRGGQVFAEMYIFWAAGNVCIYMLGVLIPERDASQTYPVWLKNVKRYYRHYILAA